MRNIIRLITVLLGVAALLSISTAPASAAYGKCSRGEFCLYYSGLEYNGIYHFSGSDWNLNNDLFEQNTDQVVGNNTLMAWNRGRSGAIADVLVYTETGGRGARDCIVQGDRGVMPRNWWNSIESYTWVNRASCRAHGIIDLKR
jgi:Peptidase inhibitor family I36